MPLPEHIHIITAGTDIFPAYVRALRDHDDITGTVVVADEHFYTISSHEEKPVQAARERTRNAVAKVRAHAAALKIPVSFVFITPPVLETAKNALFPDPGGAPGRTAHVRSLGRAKGSLYGLLLPLALGGGEDPVHAGGLGRP